MLDEISLTVCPKSVLTILFLSSVINFRRRYPAGWYCSLLCRPRYRYVQWYSFSSRPDHQRSWRSNRQPGVSRRNRWDEKSSCERVGEEPISAWLTTKFRITKVSCIDPWSEHLKFVVCCRKNSSFCCRKARLRWVATHVTANNISRFAGVF